LEGLEEWFLEPELMIMVSIGWQLMT